MKEYTFERTSFLLQIIGVAFTPLIFVPQTPEDPFLIPKDIFVALLACLTIVAGLYPARNLLQQPSRNALTASFLFLCCIALSIPGSTNYHEGLSELKRWTYLAVLFVGASRIRWNYDLLRMLMRIGIMSSSVVALSLILEFFGIFPFYLYPLEEKRLYSFFGYQNMAAQYLNFTFLWCLGLTATSETAKTRTASFMCLLLTGTALLLSFCRGAIISSILGTGIFLLYYTAQNAKNFLEYLRIKPVFVIYIILVMLLISITFIQSDKIIQHVLSMFERMDTHRLTTWKDTVSMFKTSMLRGVGLGNYSLIYPLFKTGEWSWLTVYAHNELLHMAAETGIAGLAGIILFLTVAFKRAKHHIQRTSEPKRKGLLIAVMAGAVATLLHSMVSYNLHAATSSYFFALSLGILWADGNEREDQSVSGKRLSVDHILLFLAILVSLTGLFGEYRRSMGHYHYSEALLLYKKQNMASINYTLKAVHYQPYNPKYHYLAAVQYWEKGKSEMSEAHMRKVRTLSPYVYGGRE